MKRTVQLVILGVAMAGLADRAKAAAVLTLYDGVNPLISITDNSPGDGSGLTGVIDLSTNIGVWNLTIASAVTKPFFGSATSPVMDINVTAISTAAGILSYTFSDNGFGPATGNLVSSINGQAYAGSGTVTYDVYGDPANVVGATTVHIAGPGTIALPVPAGTTSSGLLALGAPFSLTQVVSIVAGGQSVVQIDASFNVPVPEPGSIGLAMLGLLIFAKRGFWHKV